MVFQGFSQGWVVLCRLAQPFPYHEDLGGVGQLIGGSVPREPFWTVSFHGLHLGQGRL